MAGSDRLGGSISTVLRGDSLRTSVRQECTPLPKPASGDAAKTINGVPMSAARHCCGRGCQHCRIYWRKTGD